MGWLFSVALLTVGLIYKNDVLVVTSGLFTIAGSIGAAAVTLKNNNKNDK